MNEKWSFVLKKEDNCIPGFNSRCGDNWDHVAEHRLVLSVVNGKRSQKHVRQLLLDVKRIMDNRLPRLIYCLRFEIVKMLLLYIQQKITENKSLIRLFQWIVFSQFQVASSITTDE